MSFTVQGAAGDVEQVRENFNPEAGIFQFIREGPRRFVTGGADVYVQARRFSFFSEAYLQRTEPPNAARFTSFGAWAQADYVIWGKVLDAGVRLSYLDVDLDLEDDLLYIGEAQLAWL